MKNGLRADVVGGAAVEDARGAAIDRLGHRDLRARQRARSSGRLSESRRAPTQRRLDAGNGAGEVDGGLPDPGTAGHVDGAGGSGARDGKGSGQAIHTQLRKARM